MADFTKENARDMQARSVESRRRNTEKRKALREILLDELTKPVSEGSTMTKLEWLIAKAVNNTKDEVTLADLQRLQELLGEKTTNNIVNLTANRDSEQILKEVFGDEC